MRNAKYLSDFYDFQYGKGNNNPDNGGQYPVYGSNGIIGWYDKYNSEDAPVIGHIGANCGSVVWANGKHFVTYNGIICKIKSGVNSRFAYYALLNSHLETRTRGAAQPFISYDLLNRVSVYAPIIEMQNKIASILSSYDRLIENNTRRIRLLEQMAENLYKEWFVRFRFPGHEKVEMVNGLPKGWETIHIKELAQLKSGYAFKSEWFIEEGEAVAKIKDIGNILMDTSSFSYVDKENCIKAKKFLLTTGDLTIALTGATIGKISIVPKHKGNIYTNQRLGKFFLGDNPMEKLPFLYCLFKQESMVSNIVNLSNSSSAQPNISPEQIEKIKILGNHDIISMYNKTCNPLFSNILALYSQNQLLTRQRDLLLPRLMSGKLEIKS
ncbi:restriction endonuclease subunit S [Prevotella jejuni]|uniref:restriction endonuclease subunit S n=1 Tax=Prevotella jejuni TaxID=1177574 RepID=UPI001BA53B16|nr:restriction endonuclease subunit S [Prevotella jejuni]QUB79504.1 restriction endonuclease subunit S [Prevotella jejuni]